MEYATEFKNFGFSETMLNVLQDHTILGGLVVYFQMQILQN